MASDTEYRFIYVTAKDRGEALSIGRSLVEQRLVACANVVGGMTAVYVWEGKVEEGEEAVLIAKTTADRVEAAIAAVKAVHTYTCPCIVALPILTGHPDYLAWIHDVTHL